MTQVSIVVPCRNEARYIASLLAAIAAQDRPAAEIVIIDGRSTDGTRGAIERFRQQHPGTPIVVVDGPAGAIPASLNIGVKRTTGDVIVRLDAHSLPQVDYVRKALARLSEEGVGIVGGRWEVAPGAATLVARAIALAAGHPVAAGDAAYRLVKPGDASRDVESVPFGCYRRAVWERLGGYAEDLAVAEDYEFNHRVRELGLRVVLDPDVCSTYFARATWRSLARQYFRYGWWKGEVFRRFPHSWRLRSLVPAGFVASLIVLAIGGVLAGAFRGALVALAAAYSSAIALGALHAVGRRSLPLAPHVAVSFTVMHLSHGTGLLLNLAARRLTRRWAR
jgi:glycosyltransferase involved in cell wall biosynthesis